MKIQESMTKETIWVDLGYDGSYERSFSKTPNDIEIKHTGTSFPSSIKDGEYVLRTDYQPARLFRKQGTRYIKIEDDKRGSWSAANSVLNSFINNTFSSPNTSDGKERQFLSKVVKPKAD